MTYKILAWIVRSKYKNHDHKLIRKTAKKFKKKVRLTLDPTQPSTNELQTLKAKSHGNQIHPIKIQIFRSWKTWKRK